MPGLVRPSNPQSPPDWPHFCPGLDQHRKPFDRVNATEEQSGSRSTGHGFRFDLGESILGHIDAVWDRCDRHAEFKSPDISSFCFASRDVALGSSQITSLVQPPRNFFLGMLMPECPGLQHSSNADHARDSSLLRQNREVVIVRKPDSVVMEKINRAEVLECLGL